MEDIVRQSLEGKTSNTTQKGLNQALGILNAARDVFVEEGYSKLSMRGVAYRAGIRLGALQHYYKTKDDLIEAMLLHVLEDIQSAIDDIISSLPDTSPVDQFIAVMNFVIDLVNSGMMQKLFFELGALATRYKVAADIMDKVFSKARGTVRHLLANINPDLNTRELAVRAALVLELLMGTMFVSGKQRPRGRYLGNIEQDTVQAMVEIALK